MKNVPSPLVPQGENSAGGRTGWGKEVALIVAFYLQPLLTPHPAFGHLLPAEFSPCGTRGEGISFIFFAKFVSIPQPQFI
jgi:hypothetical protein